MKLGSRTIGAPALLWIVVASATIAAPSANIDRSKEVFAKGNALYEQGDFEGAIDAYSTLFEMGVSDKDLFYNLANACYKIDDLGRAVLYYERALKLAPRDRDVRENLALVRSQLKDKQFVREQNRLVRAVIWLHNNSSAREMVLLASSCYLLLCILGIVFVFRESGLISTVYRWLSMASPGRLAGLSKTQDLTLVIAIVAVLGVSSGISAFQKTSREIRREEAVVLEPEVAVFSEPASGTTLQFKLHEGTMVTIREAHRGWLRIRLPGGLSGWVPAGTVEKL